MSVRGSHASQLCGYYTGLGRLAVVPGSFLSVATSQNYVWYVAGLPGRFLGWYFTLIHFTGQFPLFAIVVSMSDLVQGVVCLVCLLLT